MACQSRKSDPKENAILTKRTEGDSSEWETLRCSVQDPCLKLEVSDYPNYFVENSPVRKKLSFSSAVAESSILKKQHKVLQQIQPDRILASSPIDNLASKKHVRFDLSCDISKISPVESLNILQETRLKETDLNLNTTMADDDDIIIIEENGETPKKQKQKVRFDSPQQLSKELCVFDRETITEHDYKTLADEEFLNDNIINFYLKWLYLRLSDKYKNMVHIYSSYFYSRLKSKPSKKDKDKEKTKAEKAYEGVKAWTKKIDIFEKRMLIVPICEESHWYLVIVCNPGHVLSASRERDFEKKRNYQKDIGETKGNNPFIMVLDSLGGSHSTAVSKIRSYLMFEHLEKRKVPKNFGKEKMGEKHPPIPLQPNSCDCGLFLLHYVELIFKDPEMFLGAILPDLTQWFNTEDVEFKREEIANLIKKISESNGKTVEFPRIKFPSKNDREDGKKDRDKIKPFGQTIRKERREDPRMRSRMKEGSLGEMLKADHPGKLASSRRSRFTGSYREKEPSPERSTSPTRKSARLSEGATESTTPPNNSNSSSNHQPISFQIKKKETPAIKIKEEFDPDVAMEVNKLIGQERLNSSWNTLDKSKKEEVELKYKRFLLKRDNPDTNPKVGSKNHRDREREKDYVKSSREMCDFLNRGTSKKNS